MAITAAEILSKTCTKCEIEKPLTEFYKDKTTASGYRPRCKVCVRETKLKYERMRKQRPEVKVKIRQYLEEHKEEIAARLKRWQGKNKEHIKAQRAEFYRLNKERIAQERREYRIKNKAKIRIRNLKRFYGLSDTEYQKLLQSQDGKCAGCGIPQEELSKPLYVDHDHDTGKVRGLLCLRCNMTLGNVDDNPAVLRQLIAYLEKTLCPSA